MDVADMEFLESVSDDVCLRILDEIDKQLHTVAEVPCEFFFLSEAIQRATSMQVRPYPATVSLQKRLDGDLYRLVLKRDTKEYLEYGIFIFELTSDGISLHHLRLSVQKPKQQST